jgi:ribosome-associated toxin RatA of RatAB toxin-antitoxin module
LRVAAGGNRSKSKVKSKNAKLRNPPSADEIFSLVDNVDNYEIFVIL